MTKLCLAINILLKIARYKIHIYLKIEFTPRISVLPYTIYNCSRWQVTSLGNLKKKIIQCSPNFKLNCSYWIPVSWFCNKYFLQITQKGPYTTLIVKKQPISIVHLYFLGVWLWTTVSCFWARVCELHVVGLSKLTQK